MDIGQDEECQDISLCCTPIYQFRVEEQKQKYLFKLCSNKWIRASPVIII